jgi:hypothetical protein
MFPSSTRTDCWAWVSEHGAEAEHAVPLPVGETNRVLIVAACDATDMAATPAAVSVPARTERASRPIRVRGCGGGMGWSALAAFLCG